jgi:enamine deaminase RidA (YjgF/YER057c/UK114 family)
VFVSGQIPADPNGKLIEGSVGERTAQCCKNIIAVLNAAGSSIEKVVKVNVCYPSLSRPWEVPISRPKRINLACALLTTVNVPRQQVFLVDMADFAEMNGVYQQYFAHKPARSCVAVHQLPLGVPVEIECIALQ